MDRFFLLLELFGHLFEIEVSLMIVDDKFDIEHLKIFINSAEFVEIMHGGS